MYDDGSGSYLISILEWKMRINYNYYVFSDILADLLKYVYPYLWPIICGMILGYT